MPRERATGAKVTTGVGVSFTDNLKEWTISSASLPVRQQGSSTAVPGYYSYQLNIVNFRPDTQFDAGTTYQVAVTAGVQDLAGNGATPYTGSFTTASAVSQARFDDPDHTAWSVTDNLQEGDPAYGDRPQPSPASPTCCAAAPGSGRRPARARSRRTRPWSISSWPSRPVSTSVPTPAVRCPLGSTAGRTAA